MGGLEPPQISPHAPQACASTIPPHRRGLYLIFIFCRPVVELNFLSNLLLFFDTQSKKVESLPHRRRLFIFDFQCLLSMGGISMSFRAKTILNRFLFYMLYVGSCHIDVYYIIIIKKSFKTSYFFLE